MNSLQNFVNWKLTHADKTAEASGYPLVMENCKANKKMKQLEIYGNSVQDGTPTPEIPIEVQSVGELVTDATDINYGKYKIPVITRELGDIVYPQLTQGTKNLPYEPYIEPVTTNIYLDEPLRKIGDYADYIDFKNKKVVRKCIKKYLKEYDWGNYTGVQEHDTHYAYSHRDDTVLPNYKTTGDMTKYRGYCNYLKSITSSSYSTITDAMFNYPWALNIRLTVSKDVIAEKTMSAFKAWLNENNPYMIRVLTTPTEEPLDIELPKLKTKTTVIEVDTSLAPNNAYGKYTKK